MLPVPSAPPGLKGLRDGKLNEGARSHGRGNAVHFPIPPGQASCSGRTLKSPHSLSRHPVAKIQRMMPKQITMTSPTANSDTPTGTSASPKNDQRKPEIR